MYCDQFLKGQVGSSVCFFEAKYDLTGPQFGHVILISGTLHNSFIMNVVTNLILNQVVYNLFHYYMYFDMYSLLHSSRSLRRPQNNSMNKKHEQGRGAFLLRFFFFMFPFLYQNKCCMCGLSCSGSCCAFCFSHI